jgi:glyoxylase-like metal-dependent hydrolase (beta-lactamase superfamily II)
MEQVADSVYLLDGFPRYAINVYLLDDVLVDAGVRWTFGTIMRQLRGSNVASHALTHVHPDHQGSSHAVCEALGLPLWCGDADAPAMENRGEMAARMPTPWLRRTVAPIFGGPPHPVARRLKGGEQVGSFAVIETPGHTAGHISFWRERDGVLVLGDVLANIQFLSGRPGLREPPPCFSSDPAQNRRSAGRILDLRPKLVCFGHGPPMRDNRPLMDFVRVLQSIDDQTPGRPREGRP